MSELHREIIDKYKKYSITSSSIKVEQDHKYHMFNVLSDDRILLSGVHIVIASYDTKKNILIWADVSNTLDRTMIEHVKEIKSLITENKDIFYTEIANRYMSVITTDELFIFLDYIATLTHKQVLLNIYDGVYHIHSIENVFSDNR